jgi:hypothetical protein
MSWFFLMLEMLESGSATGINKRHSDKKPGRRRPATKISRASQPENNRSPAGAEAARGEARFDLFWGRDHGIFH